MNSVPPFNAPVLHEPSVSTLTLSDLFRLAFNQPVLWLAGDMNARPSFNWVALSIEEARRGDILLLASYHPTAPEGTSTADMREARRPLSAPELARVLRQAQQAGVSAVLLLGETASPEEEPLTSPPDAAAMAIAALPGQAHDLQAIQRALLTILLNQRAALMERGVRIHAQLSQLAAEGQGLGGLAEAMAGLAGRGVIVQDKRLAILAHATPEGATLNWEEILKQVVNFELLPEAFRDRKQAAQRAVTFEQTLSGGLRRIVSPIIVAGMARGYLSLIGSGSGPTDPGRLDVLDDLIVEQGALVCAVEMARAKAVREAEKRLKGDLLNALLQENISPRDAELWAQGMDLDLSQSHAALRFAWGGSPSPSRRRLETIVNGEMARKGLRAILSPMGAEIVCFCELPMGAMRPETAILLGQSVVDQAAREHIEAPLLCGVGSASKTLNDWRVSFRQAGQALELARRFKERKALYFPDLSVYRLLIQIEHSPELSAFQEEILGPLLSNEGGRELIRTLEAYFEHNGNLSQTAEALYIHRNTLIYRMDRVASITGLNLDNPETRLAVQLALHIYRMMGHAKG